MSDGRNIKAKIQARPTKFRPLLKGYITKRKGYLGHSYMLHYFVVFLLSLVKNKYIYSIFSEEKYKNSCRSYTKTLLRFQKSAALNVFFQLLFSINFSMLYALKTHFQSRCISSITSQVHNTFARTTTMTRLQPESLAPALIVCAARVNIIFVNAVVIQHPIFANCCCLRERILFGSCCR